MTARAAISEREQIARLREENLWLRAELGLLVDAEQMAEAQKWFGLTKSEAQILLCLINSKLMTKELAMHALTAAGYEFEAEEKLIDVFVCKLRKKLKPHGAGVSLIWGTGYYLDQPSRRAIAGRLGQPVTMALQPECLA